MRRRPCAQLMLASCKLGHQGIFHIACFMLSSRSSREIAFQVLPRQPRPSQLRRQPHLPRQPHQPSQLHHPQCLKMQLQPGAPF